MFPFTVGWIMRVGFGGLCGWVRSLSLRGGGGGEVVYLFVVCSGWVGSCMVDLITVRDNINYH